MMQKEKNTKNYNTRYEFLFLINDSIIVQRNFHIMGYNELAPRSIEVKETVDYCMSLIFDNIKGKSMTNLFDYESIYSDTEFVEPSPNDTYYFQVKVDGKVVIESIMDATLFPQKVRKTVDIRKEIPMIISNLQRVLSRKDEDLTFKYLDSNLGVELLDIIE